MKLIIAIVQDEDAGHLVSALMEQGFGVTKLATTGGFLRSGNTTLISGLEDERLDAALKTIEKVCHSHEQVTTTAATPVGASGVGDSFVPYPVRVTVGGATVFVLDVDRFIKY
ncbi:MAG: cyclic-di-AMP receptor [Clostridia bacterium]|nr:cyclic-di-AMP receptor [Clostridia bacterium]